MSVVKLQWTFFHSDKCIYAAVCACTYLLVHVVLSQFTSEVILESSEELQAANIFYRGRFYLLR